MNRNALWAVVLGLLSVVVIIYYDKPQVLPKEVMVGSNEPAVRTMIVLTNVMDDYARRYICLGKNLDRAICWPDPGLVIWGDGSKEITLSGWMAKNAGGSPAGADLANMLQRLMWPPDYGVAMENARAAEEKVPELGQLYVTPTEFVRLAQLASQGGILKPPATIELPTPGWSTPAPGDELTTE
jgi:hypothetical protein